MNAVTIDIGGVLMPRGIDSVSLRLPSRRWQRFVPVRPAGIPNTRTKVGDWVRVCSTWIHQAQISGPFRVLETCRFCGVRTVHGWNRSWVRVKGGAA